VSKLLGQRISIQTDASNKMNDLNGFFSPCTTRGGTLEHHTKISFSTFEETTAEKETVEYPVLKKDQTLRNYYLEHIHKPFDECMKEAEYPQRSKEWKLARQFCLTASDFGAASGSNPFETPEELVRKKIEVPFQGNKATQWGSSMEPFAAEAFLNYAKLCISATARLYHPNLTKFSATSWLAVSPDGILEYSDSSGTHYDLVEFKCPTREPNNKHPYARYDQCIPPYYMSQMVGIKGYCNSNGGIPLVINNVLVQVHIERIWFVVWQPTDLWVTEVRETLQYSELYEKLRKWYFELYLPSLYKHLSNSI
jgi:putative phage-type endonuclease